MKYLLLTVLLSVSVLARAAVPMGISFVGFDGAAWRIYFTTADSTGGVKLQQLETSSEPREPSICQHADIAVYVDAAGALRVRSISDGNDRIVAEASPGIAYAQPTFSPDCGDVIAVSLRQGKSVDTDIVRIPLQGEGASILLDQPGAQFDPLLDGKGDLVYTHVHCVLDCGRPVIKEVWRKAGPNGAPQRISRDDAVAHHPVIHGEYIYFAYNKAGYFHIWRTDLEGAGLTQLTFGERVTDLNPSVTANGDLYFLRSAAGKTQLMRQVGSTSEVVDLPVRLLRLRDMRTFVL